MATAAPIAWQTVRNFIWLLFGAVCLILALIFWVSQSKKTEVEVIQIEQQAQDAARPVQLEKVGVDLNLGTMIEEVRPIILQQRIVTSDGHEAEFRGSKFLSEHQKSWTLQVMKVGEEDIIRSYLDKREDRKHFQYFRLQVAGQAEQFVLTYGVYKNVNEVLEKTSSIDLQLPENLKTTPEKFSSYTKMVNDLGADEMSSGLKLKTVNLTRAALPVMPLRPTLPQRSHPDNLTGGTTTTIRQTDPITQQQKVQTERSQAAPIQQPLPSLQEQRSTPIARPQPNENQVVDPF